MRFGFHQMLRLSVFGLFCLLLAGSARAQEVQPADTQLATVSAHLQQQLAQTEGSLSFLIILAEQGDTKALTAALEVDAASHQAARQAIYDHLTALARRTQAPLRAWLDAQGIPYRAFYLVNMLEVQGNAATVAALRTRPEVDRLVANPLVVGGGWRVATGHQPIATRQTRPYGLDYTQAPYVWALGYTGQGIVIASQDTGVEWDHPALMMHYRGVISDTNAMTYTIDHVYNWYDAIGASGRPANCATDAQIPCDDHGHGTHTVGTMVGDATASGGTVVGMAPGAQWIGCRNMNRGVGTPASYIACFEFFLAPYPQGGDPMTDGDPALAPHIVNNSWGCPPSEGCDANSLRQVAESMRAAGIMVVASAGNNGSACSTVRDPIALYDEVFSVGAHGESGSIAGFSSRGPVIADGSHRLKPDIVAPGVSVHSTWVNRGYNAISGTSMASPHVAGAIALLWSAVPTLTGQITLTEQVLVESATAVPFSECGESAGAVPNNTYGHGRLNVLAAVQMAQPPGALEIVVVDLEDAPVISATVTLTDQLIGNVYAAITDDNGIASFSRLLASSYRIQVTGSLPFPFVDVRLQPGEQRQVEIQEGSPTGLPTPDEPPAEDKLYIPLVILD
jgi:subtilisin family serine protease